MGLAPLEVRVWGDFALFTRPEMKVERVSYSVMTPSAARGVLEAIFWKPEMRWIVEEIHVLRPINYFSILRNEITTRQSPGVAQGWARTGGGFDAPSDRTQRHSLALRDVAYLILAQIGVRPGVGEDVAKYRDQFRRRVARGQCHSMPYLGCREFSASFGPPLPNEAPATEVDGDLGRMLLDIDYVTDGSGRGQPRFFEARAERGVMRVPSRFAAEGVTDAA